MAEGSGYPHTVLDFDERSTEAACQQYLAQVVLQVASYNFVRPHSSLANVTTRPDGTKKRERRTPAMAAGVTSHCWTLLELLTYKVSPLEARPGAAARAA